ncbi:CITRATE SYNTHASE [Salix purpurea]|uniref:CITRATE SYNTHASE n=1 Tax=Salix purpurea TaxID=77065 RepID=A0A9Q0PP78_SALPP|nr:CITRATE SYNTHASE [Salix purpurea]
MGFDSPQMQELMRLYVTIHRIAKVGLSVPILVGHLVASALSDPYLSFAAALNGLAGPLHGLPNQEVLLWIKTVVEECGENITTEQLKDHVWKILNSERLFLDLVMEFCVKLIQDIHVKGEFALKHLPDDPLLQLVVTLY